MDKQQFNKKMLEVANILTLAWHLKEEWTSDAGELKGSNDVHIWVRSGGYQETGKIKLSSIYPHNNKGQDCARVDQRVEIRVAETKTPEQIARDIQRRFMPCYLQNLALVQKWVTSANKYADQKNNNIKQIADHFGFEVRPDGQEGVIYPNVEGIYSIQAYTTTLVCLEKVTCTPDLAIKIIELLKEG